MNSTHSSDAVDASLVFHCPTCGEQHITKSQRVDSEELDLLRASHDGARDKMILCQRYSDDGEKVSMRYIGVRLT